MPLQILSGKSRSVNSEIDIQALGCMLFSMFCAVLPFNGSQPKEVTTKICETNFSRLKEVEPELKIYNHRDQQASLDDEEKLK